MILPGPIELLILLAVIIVIFGAGKFSSFGNLLGRCVGSFHQGRRDAEAIDITPGKND